MNQTEDWGNPSEQTPIHRSQKQSADQTGQPDGIWGFYAAILLLSLTGFIQWAGLRTDHQIANIVSAGVILLAIGSFLAGWFRHFRSTRLLRIAPLVLLLAAALGFLGLFEPIGVSGELVPQFAYRFRVEEPPPQPAAAAAPEIPRPEIGPRDFPGFLGTHRDGRVAYRDFETDWNRHPPRLRWQQSIGAGWSGFAIAGYAASVGASSGPYGFTMEQRGDEEWVSCYDLADGQLVWHHAEPGKHFHPLGGLGPRSTPTLSAEGRVYAQGADGVVRCLDSRDGTLLWRVDLLEMAGIDQPTAEAAVLWGRAGSPLLVDDLVVLPLGGGGGDTEGLHSLIALDAATGETRWVGGEHQISYASPVLATVAGVRQILTVNQDFAAGYSPENGRTLWTHPWPGSSNTDASCSNPTPVGRDGVLLSKGYGGGAMLLRLQPAAAEPAGESGTGESAAAGALIAAPVWSDSRVLKTKFTNVCVAGDYGYALSDGSLECVRLSDGVSQWKQPRGGRFGHGHVLIVDDVLVVLSEEGELATVALDPTAYRELSRFQALEGKTWNPPAVVGNLLVVRNAEQAAVWEAVPAVQNND